MTGVLRRGGRRSWLAVLLFAGLLFSGARVLTGAPALHAQSAKPAESSQATEKSTPEAQSGDANKEEADENDAYRHSAVVRALGRKLGLSPEQAGTAFEVTNFLVLAILLGLFLAKALPKTFRNRTGAIQKQLVEARSATEEATTRLNSVESRLAKLDEQIAAMRSQAEADLEAEGQRLRAAVEDEKAKILTAAEQEIAVATTQARRQIQQYAADLAIDQAAKKLVVSAETDRLLVQNFARRLTGDVDKEGQN